MTCGWWVMPVQRRPVPEEKTILVPAWVAPTIPREVVAAETFGIAAVLQVQPTCSIDKAHAREVVGDCPEPFHALQVIAPSMWLIAIDFSEVLVGLIPLNDRFQFARRRDGNLTAPDMGHAGMSEQIALGLILQSVVGIASTRRRWRPDPALPEEGVSAHQSLRIRCRRQWLKNADHVYRARSGRRRQDSSKSASFQESRALY